MNIRIGEVSPNVMLCRNHISESSALNYDFLLCFSGIFKEQTLDKESKSKAKNMSKHICYHVKKKYCILPLPSYLILKMCALIWKAKWQRGRDFPYVRSLSKWLQLAGLGHTEATIQELHPSLPCGSSSSWAIIGHFPGLLTESWLGTGMINIQTGIVKWWYVEISNSHVIPP